MKTSTGCPEPLSKGVAEVRMTDGNSPAKSSSKARSTPEMELAAASFCESLATPSGIASRLEPNDGYA